MKLIFLDKENYKEWDRFCLESDDAWFWHTSYWIDYTLNLRPHLNPKNKSFMLVLDGKILAICPLIVEEKEGIRSFSFDSGFCQIPAFAKITKKLKEKVEKRIFEEVDKLAKENGIKKVSFKYSPLVPSFIESDYPKNNSLNKFGYIDVTWDTQIIDLSKDIKELRKKVRHGHDSAIDVASRVLEGVIFDKDNITKKDFEEYCELHHKAAGRITRPQITFDMMYDWIKIGCGFLVGAKMNGKFVGFSLFNQYKNGVYYSSAANDPEINGILIGHFILWKAIEYMKDKGVKFFDIGYQDYGATINKTPTEKEIEISRFKRGFGGFAVPLFAGEKFYDKDYLKKVYLERIERYSDNIS